jgi:hypothetical protein
MTSAAQVKRLLKKSFYDEIFLSVENDKISVSDLAKLSKSFQNKYVGLSVGVEFKENKTQFIKELSKSANIKNIVIKYEGTGKEKTLESLQELAFEADKRARISVEADVELLRDETFVAAVRSMGFSLALKDPSCKGSLQNDLFEADFRNANYENFNEIIRAALKTNASNILFDMESFADMSRRENFARQIDLTRIDLDEMFNEDILTDRSAAQTEPERFLPDEEPFGELPPAFMPDYQKPSTDKDFGIYNLHSVTALLHAA